MYLANWATQADVDCANDDRDQDLDGEASPRGILLRNLSSRTRFRLLAHVLKDVKQMYVEDDTPLPPLSWEADGDMRYTLLDDNHEMIAVLLIVEATEL